ncbi:hypothetical protein SESBI_31274 [Sesbania bispinosa]|nr:hypothetical protein SESBI_31274 [Sesbania bispinosa]
MSPKLFSLNSVIERRKPQESTDELAIVKAAAWAWYQHGSGSEGKAMSEFNVSKTQHATRPSRYKLEAMNITKEAKEGPLFHPNKSLLDTYEVQSISRHLDRLIESAHNKVGNSNNSANNAASISMDNGKRKMNKKKRMSKGFWPRHAVVCGGGDDVVHGNALSAKRVPVVNLAKCLARAGSAL